MTKLLIIYSKIELLFGLDTKWVIAELINTEMKIEKNKILNQKILTWEKIYGI